MFNKKIVLKLEKKICLWLINILSYHKKWKKKYHKTGNLTENIFIKA